MSHKIYNFSAGPAIMPRPVLEQAQNEIMSINGIGMSVMEVSHRSKYFEPVLAAAEGGCENCSRCLIITASFFCRAGRRCSSRWCR